MQSFSNYLSEDGIDYFIIEMPQALISEQALINEGKWVKTDYSTYMQRVDGQNPEGNIQRHVHVAKAKHINNKTKQVAWNQDGTQHDKKNFNSKVGQSKKVQAIARKALNLPDSVELQESSRAEKLLWRVNESIDIPGPITPLFKLIMPSD